NKCNHVKMNFCTFPSTITNIVKLKEFLEIRINPFNSGTAFKNGFPSLRTTCWCGISSKVCCNFYFIYLLANTFLGQWTVTTFFRSCILYYLILGIETIVTIRMLSKTSWGKVFIKAQKLSFISLIVCNNGLLSHSMYLFIYGSIVIVCIHCFISQWKINAFMNS